MIARLTDRLAALLPLTVGRIVLGVMWLASLLWKLPFDFEPSGEKTGLRTWLEREVENPAFGFYGDLIDSLVLPNFTFFAWLVFLAELAVGVALLLGIFVRPAAILGLLMSVNLWIGLKSVPGEWHWIYILMAFWHLAILLAPSSSQWSIAALLPPGLRRLSSTGESITRIGQTDGGRRSGSPAATVLRVGLGVLTLDTWRGNIDKDFYDGDNFAGFFEWVAKPVEEGGNGASLGFVHSLIDATILQAPEFFGWLLTFLELFIAVGLILGLFTRAAGLAATGFFGMLFLTYFGGEEWIVIYVLLSLAALMIFLHWGGRFLGIDRSIAKSRGESPGTLIW